MIFTEWESGLLINMITSGEFDIGDGWVELPGPAEIWGNEDLDQWFDGFGTADDAAFARWLVLTRLVQPPPQAYRLLLPDSAHGRTGVGNRLGLMPHGVQGNTLWTKQK